MKLPTAAHRAIAELVKGGYVRVIVTTNFDRLLEQAIEAVGVVPTVIASADAAAGALPLAHTPCAVVKVHGDYLNARIRNTEAELAAYEEPLDRLLDRIFDEYGLVVCGWSAEWDAALRAALERCPSRRFATYWAVRNLKPPGELAQRLIDLRRAEVVPIAEADAFFVQLAEHVASLEELARPHPLSAKLAQATLKRYVVEDRHRIRFHDLVMEEANRVHAKLTGPLEGGYRLLYQGTPTPQALVERMALYKSLTETLRALLATGCYWGEAAQHGLWATCLERLANLPDAGGNPDWLNLRRYPALLALYAGGIATIAAGQYDTLAALLLRGRVRQSSQERRLVLAMNPSAVMRPEFANRLPGKERHYTPFSDYLFEKADLWEPLRELIPMEERFAEHFDRFECLLGLVHVDENFHGGGTAWGPVGRFAWRDRGVRGPRILEDLSSELAQAGVEWPPLRAGLFGSTVERGEAALRTYSEPVERVGMW